MSELNQQPNYTDPPHQQAQENQQQYAQQGQQMFQQSVPTQGYSAPQGQSPQRKPTVPAPGHDAAVTALVLGIIGVVLWFFGYSSIISIILGIIGLVLSSNAKKAGNNEGIRTAGFVLSLISLIGGTIILVACVALAGAIVGSSDLTSIY